MNCMVKWNFYFVILVLFKEGCIAEEDANADATLKCDACKIIAQKFSSSFKNAEVEAGSRRLNEDEYIEAAESTCDEDWSGYGVLNKDGAKRLIGKDLEGVSNGKIEFDNIWDRRLQDFCDELLSEAPDEKTLYNTWASDTSALEKYLCNGEGIFQACVSGVDFGAWPGDDYDDYDDFDYLHDEF